MRPGLQALGLGIAAPRRKPEMNCAGFWPPRGACHSIFCEFVRTPEREGNRSAMPRGDFPFLIEESDAVCPMHVFVARELGGALKLCVACYLDARMMMLRLRAVAAC